MSPRVERLHVWPADEPAPLAVETLVLDWGGPVGDRHHGVVMTSDSRQKWLYPRGTQIRNHRQVSVVDLGELAAIAANLGLPGLAPGTIADNICTDGVTELSALEPLSRLVIGDEDPVVIAVLGGNNPCTIAGSLVQTRYATSPERFPKAAIGLRGVTGWVERPGEVTVGMPVRVVPARPTG